MEKNSEFECRFLPGSLDRSLNLGSHQKCKVSCVNNWPVLYVDISSQRLSLSPNLHLTQQTDSSCLTQLGSAPFAFGRWSQSKEMGRPFLRKKKKKCNNNISVSRFSVDALEQKDRNRISFLLKFLIVHLYKIPGRSRNSPLGRNYGTKFMETLSLSKNYTKLQRHPHVSVQINLYR